MAAEKIDTSLEDETLASHLSGTLTFSDITSLDSERISESFTSSNSTYDGGEDSKMINEMVVNNSPVRFEVIDAKIVEEKADKHVEYTILVMQSTGFDSMPGKFQKRYSELNTLRRQLKQAYPQYMQDISFPSKRILGNFSPMTLTNRSKAFEKFLTHVFAIRELRNSKPFIRFLYGGGLFEGYRLIENCLYERASDLLVASWKLQSKVIPTKSYQCLMTLIAVVVSYFALSNTDQAQLFADLALQSFPDTRRDFNTSNVLEPKWLVALLRLNMKLCHMLGRDSRKYELRLMELKGRGISIDQRETLHEMVLHNKSLWHTIVEEGLGPC